ncbi:hypothetical protein [Bifidobacterium parmae]|uniref:Uncharacterized protein n=1 Tax=Bifidobacterium parmae TaxID=361854 RepID=A0A2N5IYY4_9BIFI|nr:hypothetical protein [Bifidobacterium parmae]PLS27156.1 hypothetical protein Uis4E_1742 [Bifidobacterium parmae]
MTQHHETPSTQPERSSGWPKPPRHDGRSWNEPKRADGKAKQPSVNANARGAAKSGRRAMPFKATGHKGGISFR